MNICYHTGPFLARPYGRERTKVNVILKRKITFHFCWNSNSQNKNKSFAWLKQDKYIYIYIFSSFSFLQIVCHILQTFPPLIAKPDFPYMVDLFRKVIKFPPQHCLRCNNPQWEFFITIKLLPVRTALLPHELLKVI